MQIISFGAFRSKKSKLNSTLDPVFQTLFSEKRKYNTENFISCILNQKIKISKIENEYSMNRSNPKEKVSRLDLYATTEDNKDIIIELQMEDTKNMPQRLQYSNCAKIAKQLERGNNYNMLHPVISIGIFNFEIEELKGLNTFCAEASLIFKDIKPQTELTKLQRYYIIHISKARELYERGSNNPLVKWCMFLINPDSMEVQKIMNENPEIKKLNDDLEEISQDEQLRKEAEFWRMNAVIADWNKQSLEAYWKKKYSEEGHKEGFEKGMKEGIEEGIKEGIEKGIEKGKNKEKIEIAKNLLKNNIDIQIIINSTGLSKEEIEK